MLRSTATAGILRPWTQLSRTLRPSPFLHNALCRPAAAAAARVRYSTSVTSSPPNNSPTSSEALAQQPRYRISFTCTATIEPSSSSSPTTPATAQACNHRSTHEFTKRSYHHGVVLVQCPQCQNRHLIADHLGWFKDATQDGKFATIEEMMKAKAAESEGGSGGVVRRGRVMLMNDGGDTIEYYAEEQSN